MSVRVRTAGSNNGFSSMVFPGGEPHVKSEWKVYSDTVYTIDARVSSFNDIGLILAYNDLLRREGARYVQLFIPYFPGARQDRGAPLTVKIYADIINAAKFDRVAIVDPHSDVAPALLERCDVIPITDVFLSGENHGVYWGPDTHVLIIPDAGAVKRVEAVASKYGYRTVQAGKHRDFKTGALSGFWCDPIPEGVQGIVVDDICDGGGTFLGLADVIPNTHLHLWVTHGIFSKGVTDLLNRYTTIRTTDSFPFELSYGSLYLDVVSLDFTIFEWENRRKI